jgi:ubiquinone/menaquinone biosynthesis C-methylase UbiE
VEKVDYKNHIEHYIVDGEYYDYFAFNKLMVVEIYRRYQEILHLGNPKLNALIMDVGSGGGEVVSLVQKIEAIYLPIDLSDHNLKKIKNISNGKTFPVNGDAYHLPFINDSIDLIMISEVIEHLGHPLEGLKEMARILKPDGKLVVSVPYKEQISYQICIHCNKPTPTHSHLHSFDRIILRDLLVEAGLKPVKFSKNLNKVMNRLHINYYLRSLPFRLWKGLDSLFNFLIDKPTSMIFLCRK